MSSPDVCIAAFKQGFARRLAEAGVAPSELDRRLKRSRDEGRGFFAGLRDVSADAARTAIFATPLLAGGVAGYMTGGAARVSPADIKALRQAAIITELEAAKRRVEQQRREAAEKDQWHF